MTAVDTLIESRGDWRTAQENNVTYGFICRLTADHEFSAESTGKVITVNPVLNPTIYYDPTAQNINVLPARGIFSVNRHMNLKGTTEKVESVFNDYQYTRLQEDDRLTWGKFIFKEPSSIEKQPFLHDNTAPVSTAKIFKAEPLTSEMQENIKKQGGWYAGCPVSLDRLSWLQ